MTRHISIAITLLLALAAPGVCLAADRVIEFRLEDQFDRVHTDVELRDRVVVILASDKNGSRFSGAWGDALREPLQPQVEAGQLLLVDVADLRGVPFFVKGSVKKKFPRDPDSRVLLDWKGRFAKAYGLEKDVCNILLVDADGRVVRRTAQTELDPALVRELVHQIERLAIRAPDE